MLKFLPLFVLLVSACSTSKSAKDSEIKVPKLPEVSYKRVNEILLLLNNKEYDKLASHIHPIDGVRFTPYGFIDPAIDKKFTPAEFSQVISATDVVWGIHDGSGEPIILSFQEYVNQFVYNQDYLNAEKTSVNQAIGKGNSVNNITEIYKNCSFSESHFSGFDPILNGMDWTTLRLVFKEHNGVFMLVGVVHDQWTI
jgi:hypothetical protein